MPEIRIPLQPKQNEFERAIEQFKIVFYGGAKGGGKSYALRNIMLARRFRYPGTTGAIFRRTYEELEANHIRPLLIQHPGLSRFYNSSKHLLSLPNGSFLEFNHCGQERDLDNYQGREFHDLGIEEAGQWPEEWFHRLRGSNRSSIAGIKPRILLTGNPGGLGHKWLKRLFIDRSYNDRERAEDYHYIRALVWDNPALVDNDPEYVHNLQAEPNEALRRAYLDGDWDVFAGQFFGEWRRDVHVLPASFKIESWWTRFGAYDHGFNHPFVFGAFAVDGDGNVYLYREAADRGKRPDQIARMIQEVMGEDWPKMQASLVHAGHDCFSKGRDGAPEISEQFLNLPRELRLNFTRANIDRVNGAAQVRSYLAWEDLPENIKGPRFFVLENCHRAVECLPRMIHDPKRPEDVMKIDATDTDPWAGDDPYDMVRYGLMSRPPLSSPPKQAAAWGSAKWFIQRNRDRQKGLIKRYVS